QQRGGDVDAEPVPRAQPPEERGITALAMSEPVVLADDHATEFHSTQQPLHERRRAQGGDLRRERDDDDMVEAELIQQPGLFLEGGEVWRAMIGVDHAARMGLEGDQHAGGAGRPGTGDERLQQGLVAAVNAIKAADRRVARPEHAGARKAEGDRRHLVNTARGWLWRATSAPPHAKRAPPGPRGRDRPDAALGAGTAVPRPTAAAPASPGATPG